jgi:predicted peptidase
VNYLKESYYIDGKRVLITGFSMGGIGTWYMAARHPEVFSAAIPTAGASDAQTIKSIGDIPIYVIHSRADTVLPIAQTEKIVAALKEQGKKIEFVVLQGVDHYDTSGFTQALKDAVPWLKKTWSEKK